MAMATRFARGASRGPAKVYLVGAGPGDPELITLKGRRVLAAADAVLYDELANAALLGLAPAAAERVYVGKRRGRHAVPQEEICAGMIARARGGATVVRLKGGDPMIFGRGGEELAALRAAGIEAEIVPGVSAANGIAAEAGIPLTLRGVAAGVRFIAGHAPVIAPPSDPPETLVIYMGLARLAEIARELRRQGWPAATEAAVIGCGTLAEEVTVFAPLSKVVQRAAAVPAPALIVIGDVVGWRRRLESGPGEPAATAAGREPGVILMAHGSRLPGWQEEVARLAATLRQNGRRFAAAAFLPPVEPGLAQAVAAAAAAGERRLIMVPYFLAAGLHVTRDLPELVAAAQSRFPEVELRTADCLEGHPALRTAILARAGEVALCWENDEEIGIPGNIVRRMPRHAAVRTRPSRRRAVAEIG